MLKYFLVGLTGITVLYMLLVLRSEENQNMEMTQTALRINKTIDDTISRILHSNLSIHQAEVPEHTIDIQRDINCLHSIHAASCVPDSRTFASYESSFCARLASKRLLLLGGPLTFALHTHLLAHASHLSPENPPHTCLGPEFCTFHHICLLLAKPHNPYEIMKKSERRIRPPSPRDLLATGSALMHYVQSDSLFPHTDKDGGVYARPIVSPGTGVRVKETYWLGSARRADVVVLGRPPIPAPAWTYDGTRSGNWSFVDGLAVLPAFQVSVSRPGTQSRLVRQLDREDEARGLRTMNAAMTATLDTFLSEVVRTLHVLRSDATIRAKTIIWHGSLSYSRGLRRCSTNIPIANKSANKNKNKEGRKKTRAERYLHAVLAGRIDKDWDADDPWALYHDTQGAQVRVGLAR